MTYQQACHALNLLPTYQALPCRSSAEHEPSKPASMPGDLWQRKAGAFLQQAQAFLKSFKPALQYLHDRGLTDTTIEHFRLGWTHSDTFYGLESWGLLQKPEGKKSLFLPAGLIIPCLVNDYVARLRIRLSKKDADPPYQIISGSSNTPMLFDGPRKVFVVVESELDGLLLHQQAGDLAAMLAIGSAQAKPDTATHDLLCNAKSIFVALDSDAPGATAAQWWARHYPQAKRWPCPVGKDIGESFQQGIDLRIWLQAAGIDTPSPAMPNPQSEPAPQQTPPPQSTAETAEAPATDAGFEVPAACWSCPNDYQCATCQWGLWNQQHYGNDSIII